MITHDRLNDFPDTLVFSDEFQLIAEAMPQIVWITRADGWNVYFNGQWVDYTGLSLAESYGHGWNKPFHPDDQQRAWDAWQNAVTNNAVYSLECRLRRKDGVYRWWLVRGVPVHDRTGKILKWVGTCTDIDEVKQAETQVRIAAERTRAADALRESEDRFRTLADNIPQLCWIAHPDGWIFWYNKRWYEYTGMTARQMEGWGWQSVHDPKALPQVMDRWQVSIATGKPFDMVFPLRGSDGVFRSFLTRVMPVHGDDGIIVRWFGTNTDVTEQKLVESERETQIEFLRLVNESASTEELVRAASGFFQRQSGVEAVGIRLREGIDYPYYETRGFPDEFVLLENDLCSRDAAGNVLCDGVGNPVLECMCGNVINGRFDPTQSFFTGYGSFWSNCTTDLLASTSEADCLARTRNRCNGEGYESVALIPLNMGNDRLGLLQMNDRQPGKFTPELIAVWERLCGYLAVAVAKFRTEEKLQLAYGELESRVEERTEELARAVATLKRENAERTRVEQELREKEGMLLQQSRMAAMGDMLFNIAHQWRQPLNALGLTVQQLGLLYEFGEFNKEILDESIEKATDIVQHLSQTINDFTGFSKPDKAKTRFPASRAVQKTLSLTCDNFSQQNIAISVEVSEEPEIDGYPNEFGQVLLNILMNAFDALQERGNRDATIKLRVWAEAGKTVVTITDNAGGIDQDAYPKIFDPFFTTKEQGKGTGIGLFLAKTIIEKNMGGRLSAKNVGDGAEFRIEVNNGTP